MTLFTSFHPGTRLLALGLALYASLAGAQPTASQTPRIAAPADTPYLGPIAIDVDLTDLDRRIMHVRETLPVKPGALTLLYPRWLPGKHSPAGAVTGMAGLQITANGKPLEWIRDPVDVYAFHLQVPEGVKALNIAFQHLSPVTPSTGRVVMTQEIIGLQWNTVVLYPAGHYASAIQTQASAKLPGGWQTATALDVAKREGDRIVLQPTSLERLVDSPLWAGKYTKRMALDAAGKAPVYLTLFADAPAHLEVAPEQLAAHQQLVRQADALFGARHFARYEFLLALSERFSGIGLEHAESSENAVSPNFFTEWKKKETGARAQLPHEYVHSWNGKFRIPADLWTPNFNVPMQGSLLWMYEGQTQYWGFVLAARSGMVSLAESLDSLAMTAASLDTRNGRAWRNLQDTTTDPVVSGRGPVDWADWQRREEYYTEGQMVWLDADTKIRELTQGAKSLNDAAKLFFGVEDGRVTALTYTMDDVVKALHTVVPFDWAGFLRQRLDSHSNATLLDGITRGGWKLVFTDKQSDAAKASEATRRTADFAYSLGLAVDKDGKLTGIKWGGPAFKAGLTASMQLVAVNSESYKAELLREAISKAKDGSGVELLVKIDDRYKTVKLDYRGGLRYPKLERIAGTPDRLTDILTGMP
jgi:predicted metalloprotease with PDZ domain